MRPGRFVTFEGGEGAGKSSQQRLLTAWLQEQGSEVLATREPGGTEGAEAIRALLVEGRADRWSATAEMLLVVAARVDHVARRILPALERGAWVLCDRYIDSTRVYQGLAGGLGIELIDRLQLDLLALRQPDLTILLDVPVETGLARREAAGAGGRFEAKGLDYHRRVRDGFLALAAAEPERIIRIDATAGQDEVARAVQALVVARLGCAA